MRTTKMILAFSFLLCPASCLGENGPVETIDEELARYPDLGRTALDPVVPGTLTLTFDDGPGPYTKDIVDVLDRHGIVGTFFVIGRSIPGHRDALTYASDHGHQIANHSENHEPQPSLTEAQFKFRLLAVKTNIGDADLGRLYFRFPYGAAGDAQLRWLSEVDVGGGHYRPVGWHADSHDYEFDARYPSAPFSATVAGEELVAHCGPDAAELAHDLVGWTQFAARRSKGGVMLFHDIKRITHDKIEEVIAGFESSERYWFGLSEERRAAYVRVYECAGVDPRLSFTFRPLHDGAYPSFR